ncbi:MAG: PQQ-binding-like beta-propeller repeat protein [Janthinobacterium lividum]
MTVLDTTEFDFSQEHALGTDKVARRVAVVRNESGRAVLHVGVKSPVPWLDVYPGEFALAPSESQALTAELRPDLAGHAALAAVQVSLFGQYLAVSAADAADLPADLEMAIAVTPPLSNCPHCAADLPEGATECRRCGERIRLCWVCGTPNTWLAKVCRLNTSHILRMENDWRMAPGGDASHAVSSNQALGVHLARRWSSPSFAPTRAADALEWSAPLTAFGMVIASGIDTPGNRASIYAFELATGAALWDFDLPDSQGLYPDRGAMALSEDGMLYAATLGGSVLAMDAIRGTRRWETKVAGAVYGGVTLSDNLLLVPAGETLAVLDRNDGSILRTLPLGGQSDTAPAVWGGGAFVAGDDHLLRAFDLTTGAEVWATENDGPFDAAPLVRDGIIYAATMAGTVYALEAATGSIRWQTSVSSKGISVTPALSADGLLFVACDDGFMHIVASSTGNLIRSRRVSAAPLRSSPVCSGPTVFVGADDGTLYSLDADYAVRRAYETSPGTRLGTAGPALYGDYVVCAATNGVLYVLQAT